MHPRLSVIIASFNAQGTITACLQSLATQRTEEKFEVIVVDSSTDATPVLVRCKFPNVTLCTFSDRKFCGDARNAGISIAKGDIIAFIDADCVADRGWVDEILKAHQSSHLAIGGAIANREPSSIVGWGAYFCEFSQWMPNIRPTWLADVAGANMSYKRKIFEELGPFIEGSYCSDTDFHWRLSQIGHRIRFVPSILVFHHYIDGFPGFIRHEYHHGQSFARVRVEGKQFSRLKRFIYVMLAFLIPAKRFLEIVRRSFGNRTYVPEFVKVSPLVLLGLVSWAVGEWVGYIRGGRNEKSD
jgi:GT2 family glycosyltransferase